jgi:anti-sigma28 factor (negative regulator of flagellin synthesis)
VGVSSAAAAPAPESQENDRTREVRVSELREKYRDGTYHVDTAKLSAKLVEAHIER